MKIRYLPAAALLLLCGCKGAPTLIGPATPVQAGADSAESVRSALYPQQSVRSALYGVPSESSVLQPQHNHEHGRDRKLPY
ncbi:hypothetical protein M3223_02485 [Paenibacillus pasadenensis]|uniref:hypothetical protein n=1 Tax=Paenibacillus pasadenensis TaxID=217090 RepID=UPI00203AA252|nr:hypothetical protein [Paenibacillus pasadenensis]MCM3746217.1 hypothetical protein [Paenibacillus pasadenensis]